MTRIETEDKILRLANSNFGFETPKVARSNGEEEVGRASSDVAEKRSESHRVNSGRGPEDVRHFYTLVPRKGRFDDIGSRWVKFEPEWRVTNSKGQS